MEPWQYVLIFGIAVALLGIVVLVKKGYFQNLPLPGVGGIVGPGLLLNAIKLVGATLILQVVLVLLFGWSTLWLLVIYGPLMILLAIRAAEPNADVKKALGVLALVGFIAAGWFGVKRWWSPPCDQTCQVHEQEAAAAQAEAAATLRAVGPKTAQCPGGVDNIPVTGDTPKPVKYTPCQVRIHVTAGTCALLYDDQNKKIGESCKNGSNTIDGIIYAVSAEPGKTARLMVTYCPLGSQGRNIGSCT